MGWQAKYEEWRGLQDGFYAIGRDENVPTVTDQTPWRMRDGRVISVGEMTDQHVCNILRIFWGQSKTVLRFRYPEMREAWEQILTAEAVRRGVLWDAPWKPVTPEEALKEQRRTERKRC